MSELTVEVAKTWPLAQDLLLGEGSNHYIAAMSCLTRRGQGQHRRWREHRAGTPSVTSLKNGGVKVVVRMHSWVDAYRVDINVGAWRIRAGVERWTLRLRPPAALMEARWDEIMVDTGGRGAESARPKPDLGRGSTALVWRPEALKAAPQEKPPNDKASVGKEGAADSGATKASGGTKTDPPPSVTVSFRPSWQRSWAAQNNRLVAVVLDRAGELLAMVSTTVLLLYAGVLYRRRPVLPNPVQKRTLRNLTVWAIALISLTALTLTDDVLVRYLERRGPGLRLQTLIISGNAFALVAAAVLFYVARPPQRLLLAAGVLALPPVAVAVAMAAQPDALILYETSTAAPITLGLASACLMALTVLGFTAAAWRLATDGGLLPPSRRFPGNERVFRLRIAGPIVLMWTTAVAVFFTVAQERNWQRAAWLSNRTGSSLGADRRDDFVSETVWAVGNGQDWILAFTWLLSAVAILAVLRTWRSPSAVSPFEDRADRLLLLVFFAHVVSTFSGYFVGSSAVALLWEPLLVLSLYWTVAPFTRRSVLAQPLERSGRPLSNFTDPASRARLLRKSRAYRETHAVLRRLDQGMFGDTPPERSALERKLKKLHNWSTTAGPDRLPSGMSVVDGALALGPGDNWWANGSRCALMSLIPSVPASLLMTWAWTVKGEAWQSTLLNRFGVPSLFTEFLFWMPTWVGAAFVMGTLWRQLPGRRGAAKALPVTAAFALLVTAEALVHQFTGEGSANLPLEVSAMLFVLTVTAIAMDFDTFRGERRYWQSRLGLLLSIYQMRYYSLQAAYLIAQVIAMIAIWEFFTEPDVVLKFSDLK
ncbi:hypothetical protein FQU76_13060 [Streptomyces qinzhouensis]|uniref:Uncharacterized protein n=1 Tax=Streptomyces qinzhouensis TaxID=2599401 RepID=A0A5B8JBM5_9ACTN|nr:hypothetical protein FQU76_13060 [Streptomyces qinzhouensis]